MPTRVEKRGDQYCVVKTDGSGTEKCYDEEADAKRYSTALNMAHARAKGYIHRESELEEDIEVKRLLREWDGGDI